MKNRYTLLAFDIDGTLVDTEGTSIGSLQKTVKDLMGLEISDSQALSTFGIPSWQVPGIYGYSNPEEFEMVWEANFIALNHLMHPFPGVLDALQKLKDAGFVIGAVTSRTRKEMENDRNSSLLAPFFQIVITANDTPNHKPHPEPTLELLKRASALTGRSIPAQECLYFGDTAHDYGCAHGAGVDFALADWKCKGLQGIDATYRFTSAAELLDILL